MGLSVCLCVHAHVHVCLFPLQKLYFVLEIKITVWLNSLTLLCNWMFMNRITVAANMSWAINRLSYVCIKYSSDNLKLNKFIKHVVSTLLTPSTVGSISSIGIQRNSHIWAKMHSLVWEDFVPFLFPFFFFKSKQLGK